MQSTLLLAAGSAASRSRHDAVEGPSCGPGSSRRGTPAGRLTWPGTLDSPRLPAPPSAESCETMEEVSEIRSAAQTRVAGEDCLDEHSPPAVPRGQEKQLAPATDTSDASDSEPSEVSARPVPAARHHDSSASSAIIAGAEQQQQQHQPQAQAHTPRQASRPRPAPPTPPRLAAGWEACTDASRSAATHAASQRVCRVYWYGALAGCWVCAGVRPWHSPWTSDGPVLCDTQRIRILPPRAVRWNHLALSCRRRARGHAAAAGGRGSRRRQLQRGVTSSDGGGVSRSSGDRDDAHSLTDARGDAHPGHPRLTAGLSRRDQP